MAFVLGKPEEKHRIPVMDIFSHHVEHGFAAYPETRLPYKFFNMFLGLAEMHPALGAVDDSGRVAGFGLLRPYHAMSASGLRRRFPISSRPTGPVGASAGCSWPAWKPKPQKRASAPSWRTFPR